MRKANAAKSLPNAKGGSALKNVSSAQSKKTVMTNAVVEKTTLHPLNNSNAGTKNTTNGNFLASNDICTSDGKINI